MPLAKKTGQALRSAQPLPSEKNPAHTYGMPGTYRSAQTVREKGAVEAPMKHIMQVSEMSVGGGGWCCDTGEDLPRVPVHMVLLKLIC